MKHTASIEMAPSFSLFNQSFDSFGDGHYFNVESSLQNDSFGIGRTGSADPDGTTNQLLRSSSGGNFAQQLLVASGSGTLAIGYSPVNSFGNMSAGNHHQHRRGGSSTMVVGGPDPRAASPTQVLGMYRSYSGGGVSVGRPLGPLDDSHLRMSVGSFGAPSMAYSRSYGGEPSASPGYYYGPSRSQDASDKTPPFYIFLKRYRAAFKDCTFLLPGLKAALLETPLSDSNDPAGGSSQVTVDGTRSPKWDPMVRSNKVSRTLLLCSIICVLTLFPFLTRAMARPDRLVTAIHHLKKLPLHGAASSARCLPLVAIPTGNARCTKRRTLPTSLFFAKKITSRKSNSQLRSRHRQPFLLTAVDFTRDREQSTRKPFRAGTMKMKAACRGSLKKHRPWKSVKRLKRKVRGISMRIVSPGIRAPVKKRTRIK